MAASGRRAATRAPGPGANVATVVERDPADVAKNPWLEVYDDQTPNSIPQLLMGPEIQQIALEQVLEMLQGGMDPQKAMDDAPRPGSGPSAAP